MSPHIIRPPKSTAPVPLPGMPRARSGANAPAAAVLFAASLAAMPYGAGSQFFLVLEFLLGRVSHESAGGCPCSRKHAHKGVYDAGA